MILAGQPSNVDPRRISIFEGQHHLPRVLEKPLTFVDDVWPYQDRAARVTFGVKAPLACALEGGEKLKLFIEQEYLPPGVLMMQPQCRVIGASVENFDSEPEELIHWQVVCALAYHA
jgi:hypothetical protein